MEPLERGAGMFLSWFRRLSLLLLPFLLWEKSRLSLLCIWLLPAAAATLLVLSPVGICGIRVGPKLCWAATRTQFPVRGFPCVPCSSSSLRFLRSRQLLATKKPWYAVTPPAYR